MKFGGKNIPAKTLKMRFGVNKLGTTIPGSPVLGSRSAAASCGVSHLSSGHPSLGHLSSGHLSLGHLSSGHLSLGHLSSGHLSLGHLSSGHLSSGHLGAKLEANNSWIACPG